MWIIQENTHTSIIVPCIWERIQIKSQERSLPTRSQRSSYLLSGLLQCGLRSGDIIVQVKKANMVFTDTQLTKIKELVQEKYIVQKNFNNF